VQLAAILLFLAYTRARPDAIGSGECLQGHPPHKCCTALPRCEADASVPFGQGTSTDDESDHPLEQGQTQAKTNCVLTLPITSQAVRRPDV